MNLQTHWCCVCVQPHAEYGCRVPCFAEHLAQQAFVLSLLGFFLFSMTSNAESWHSISIANGPHEK